MNILQRMHRHGVKGCAAIAAGMLRKEWQGFRLRNAPRYANPTAQELDRIEQELRLLGVEITDLVPSAGGFTSFKEQGYFPEDYVGGAGNPLWDEKLLEHWIASERLALRAYKAGDVYVDVAAASSPWAHAVRQRLGIEAYAIDLGNVGRSFRELPYYRIEDATATSFAAASVRGASLHCAYETFLGDDDTLLIREAARILAPGGKMVIVPLYLHTHYCAYATAEYYGKGYCDPAMKEYVRFDCTGVPSSRKYSAAMLKSRVLEPITREGMSYTLLALRNKEELGRGIYCHFILEITR